MSDLQKLRVEDLSLPVPYHHTMDVFDSSKIQSFMGCPRGFFFSHVLGLTSREPNIHLGFGSAWHDGLEVLQNEGYTEQGLKMAMEKFIETFNASMKSEDDGLDFGVSAGKPHPSKNLETGIKGLQEYFQQFRREPHETMYTEVVGTVPISPHRVITVKLDTIYKDLEDDTIWSKEHKTTGRLSKSWKEGWEQKFQVKCYNFFLHAQFGEQHGGLMVNGAVFRKTNREFVRIPIYASAPTHLAWIYQANHWIDLMMYNFKELEQSSESDPSLNCFPPNTEGACGSYGCRFGGLCETWTNPLRHLDRCPSGYKKEFWDPNRELSRKANYKMENGNVSKLDKTIEDLKDE